MALRRSVVQGSIRRFVVRGQLLFGIVEVLGHSTHAGEENQRCK